MKAIVAVDLNWGIGYKGDLLEKIPEDLKFFKQMTLGKVVIMGRKTLESLPNKKPLKDRVNIVLSKDENFSSDEVLICRSTDELFGQLEKYNTDDIFIMGGEAVYKQLIPYCDEAYITMINNIYDADKYCPNLDTDKTWTLAHKSPSKWHNNIQYNFLKYVKKK